MRSQRRHFVVEVKRGTSRSAFMTAEEPSARFGEAEAALFGRANEPAPVKPHGATKAEASAGRILRDLHEPPPAPLPPEEPPRRRGREPGSKNRPKPAGVAPVARTPGRPRRVPAPAAPIAWPIYVPGFDEEDEVVVPASSAPVSPPVAEPSTAAPASASRTRLRDRSTILRRYVYGQDLAPGQPGWLRAQRKARG